MRTVLRAHHGELVDGRNQLVGQRAAWPAATRLWAMLEISSLKASGLILLRILRTATLAPWYAYMLPPAGGGQAHSRKIPSEKRVGDNRRNRWRLAETAIHTVGRYL